MLAGARPSDQHHPDPHPSPPTSLLSQLQHDLAANARPRPTSDRPLLDATDRSLQVHAAHGQDRQVEVLRELLVGLLADDPTLEPRDVVVLCPDIERFAPLISAAFGLADDGTETEHPGPPDPGAVGRPRTAPAEPAARGPRQRARSRRLTPGGVRGPRPVRPAAGRPTLLVHRRRPRPTRPAGRGERGPLGPGHGGAEAVRVGSSRPEHLGGGPGPAAARGDDGRGGQPLHRHGAAAGRGRLLRRGAGRPAGRVRRSAGHRVDRVRRRPLDAALGGAGQGDDRGPHRHQHRGRLADRAGVPGAHARWPAARPPSRPC